MTKPIKKMKSTFQSILSAGQNIISGTTTPTSEVPSATQLFPVVDPAIDGPECLQDCATCEVHLPKGWKIDEDDDIYGQVKGWATHVVVATGKSNWKRDVEDEDGSVMEALHKERDKITNGRLMLSASNIPIPEPPEGGPPSTTAYSCPTVVFLLPAMLEIKNITQSTTPALLPLINSSPTTTTALNTHKDLPSLPEPLTITPLPRQAIILLCSHRTRDARCGQSAPLLYREFSRSLRDLGLYRDAHDSRPDGVSIHFISHVGGHKYSANVMVYRRRSPLEITAATTKANVVNQTKEQESTDDTELPKVDAVNGAEAKTSLEAEGAVQGIWLGRVRPEDCEGIIKYTVLQGKVVKPDRQLRGGFDRQKGLVSW